MAVKKAGGLAGRRAKRAISTVGKDGRGLTYRGYAIEDLAEHGSFEETAYLLIRGQAAECRRADGLSREACGGEPAAGYVAAYVGIDPSRCPSDGGAAAWLCRARYIRAGVADAAARRSRGSAYRTPTGPIAAALVSLSSARQPTVPFPTGSQFAADIHCGYE